MARPTLEEQIAKAAEEGNLEKVRELAKRLKKPPTNTKAKQKSKPKQKKQVSKILPSKSEELPANAASPREIREAPSRIILPGKENDFIVSSKSQKKIIVDAFADDNDDDEEESPAKSKRKDGKVSRVLPFDTSKKINQWKDNKKDERGDVEIDKKLGSNRARQVELREPVKKISVKCKKCKQMCLVWPGEVLHSRWTCDDCLSDH
jgi:hypothetical protein